MKIEVSIPFQASITFENENIHVVGPKSLLLKVRNFTIKFGKNPLTWPKIEGQKDQDEILIGEFIDQLNSRPFIYNHEELCHCRMIKTETVKNAIKAGCHSVSDVSRTTLAGTGCGSCRKDIDEAIKALTG